MDDSWVIVISSDEEDSSEKEVEPIHRIPSKVQQQVKEDEDENDEDDDDDEDEEDDDEEKDEEEDENDEEDDKKDEEEDEEEDEEDIHNHPSWLPDGWTMEVNRGDDGTIFRYYTSPVSGITFRMKSEVLNYLFAEMDEHFIESKDHCDAENRLPRTHEWLPEGWIVEIRAGGDNMDKMYKFYVYPAIGLRLSSKEDVLLYVNKMKISTCETDGKCDMTSRNNILANVEFNPSGLPQGWVKEVVFRKTKEGIRHDPYFTDPVSHYVFRTMKSAMRYLETGEVTKRAFIQRTSVHDLYSFEKSADLHESLRKRLMTNWKDEDQSTPLVKQKMEMSNTNYKIANKADEVKIEPKSMYHASNVASSSRAQKGPRSPTPPLVVERPKMKTLILILDDEEDDEEEMNQQTKKRAK